MGRELRRGRALHLLDVENLAGGTAPGLVAPATWLPDYRAAAEWRAGDHAWAACSTYVFLRAGFDLPPGIGLVAAGAGPDAADHALVDRAPPQWTAGHYERVVIGSGDHHFADLAKELRYLGCEIWVVSRHRSLSRELALEANVVHRLPSAPLDLAA